MEDYIFWIIMLTVIVLLLIATYLVRRNLAQKKLKKIQIPEEVIEQFELCERKLKECKGNKTPYEIMWEIANEQSNNNQNMKGGLNEGDNGNTTTRREIKSGTDSGVTVQTEPRVETTNSSRELEGRSNISTSTTLSSAEHSNTTIGTELESAKPRRSFFSRFKK